jgi:hypothetical protein
MPSPNPLAVLLSMMQLSEEVARMPQPVPVAVKVLFLMTEWPQSVRMTPE